MADLVVAAAYAADVEAEWALEWASVWAEWSELEVLVECADFLEWEDSAALVVVVVVVLVALVVVVLAALVVVDSEVWEAVWEDAEWDVENDEKANTCIDSNSGHPEQVFYIQDG